MNPIDLQKKAIAICQLENLNKAYTLENKRWHTFWNRSFININQDSGKDNEGFQIGHNYQLFRYMLACNEGGELPLKFNGGIFTVEAYADQQYPNNNTGAGAIENTDPDFRRWGNLFMAQNQRWIGWPAVATGDTALMNVSRKFYRQHYAAAKQRAKNLGAQGACYLEPISLVGLSSDVLPTPQSTSNAAHLKYHFVMGLENAWQALCIHLSTNTNIDQDMPWMIDVVRFYDSFYQNQNKKNTGTTLNAQNKLVLYPCTGLELTGNGTNPIETVAALYAVVEGLLNFEGLTNADKTYLTQVKMRLPELPETTKNGKKILALANKWEALYNGWELPELYTAWPYRLIGVTRPGTAQIGIDTWNSIEPRGDGNKAKNLAKMDMSWMPTWVDMAALGLTQEAKKRAIAKLSYQAKASPGLRFTAYFGPGHDWMPDHNWGGSAMVGLQEMLLAAEQKANGKIYLFPAWPTDWNVDFKLYAPGNTVINCSLKNGVLVKMNVFPASRRKNIVLPEGLKIYP